MFLEVKEKVNKSKGEFGLVTFLHGVFCCISDFFANFRSNFYMVVLVSRKESKKYINIGQN